MFLSKIFWATFARLLDRRSFRLRAGSFVARTQALLGAGAGGSVGSSGEETPLKLLKAKSASPDEKLCVFDVGANQGQYLASVLQELSPHPLSVHSFEPSAATFAVLKERFGANPSVFLNPIGLGERPGEFELFSNREGSPLASLTRLQDDYLGITFTHSESVQIHTLDSYCAANGIRAIDLLKIDVEGHELDVLRGGSNMFSQGRIRLVTFEFGACNVDTRTFVRDFWKFFQQHSIKSFYRIMPSGRLFPIDSYSTNLEIFRCTNFLVVMDPALRASEFE